MKSGMVCAEAVFALLETAGSEVVGYPESLQQSWVWEELRAVRNIRPAFSWGLLAGLGYAALETYVLKGKGPWTFAHHADHTRLKPAKDCPPIIYPKPDGVVSFDRLSSVQLSNTAHDESQPGHLKLADPALALSVNLAEYGGPEEKYCPAGVYEFVADGAAQRLQINFANCVHCKTCDIKDPRQNITWTTPQGGDGPNYPNM
jgi:electron-transferring-flavoprotein dehydrogenase